MGPKASPKASKSVKTAAVVTPSATKEKQLVKISDVSLSDASGWRDVSEDRVSELVDTFTNAGLYGVGLLRRPSLVMVNGEVKLDVNGTCLLLDGKHTFHALKRCAELYASAMVDDGDGGDASSGPPGPTFTPLLVKAITEGVEVDWIEFRDDDSDLRAAYAAQMHDEATNKYKVTSLRDLVMVATRYQKKAPGGSWDHVRDALLAIYGSPRRTFVHRMLVAAQVLPMPILLKLEGAKVPNSYIYDNKYFVGHGADKAMRLSDPWRLAVLDIFSEEVSKGASFSRATFESEICRPAKHASDWLRMLKHEYGALAVCPAVERVQEFLMSPRARDQVLSCLRRGIKLDSSSEQSPGITNCIVVRQSLEDLKKRGTAPPGGEAADAAAGVGQKAGADVPDAQPVGEETKSSLLGAETIDAAMVAANAKLEAELAKVNVYETFAQMQGIVSRTVLPGEKLVFFIDMATSKARMPLAALEDVARFIQGHGPVAQQRVRLFITAGNRMDLAAAIEKQVRAVLPDLVPFFVPLTSGPTQGRKKLQFLIVSFDPASAKVLLSRATQGAVCSPGVTPARL